MKNNRRSFFLKSTLAFFGLASAPSVFASAKPKKVIDGRFVHMVFFWMSEGANPQELRIATEKFLKKVPEVMSYHLGEPAGTPREVVDNTYGVSLIVTFKSKEDQDAYQVNNDHKIFIEENKHLWTKVQIYDSWGQL